MFTRRTLALGRLVLLQTLLASSCLYAQSSSAVSNPRPRQSLDSAPRCHELTFDGHMSGGEKYSRELGENLWVRFNATQKNWGWQISVEQTGSADDFAFPFNPPFHFGNSEYLSTGYGETVESQLKVEHKIFFALNRHIFEQAAKLHSEEVMSSDPEGAGRFLKALPAIPTGILYVKPTKFELANSGESVNWMEYSARVIVPDSFRHASNLIAKERPCPPMHWGP